MATVEARERPLDCHCSVHYWHSICITGTRASVKYARVRTVLSDKDKDRVSISTSDVKLPLDPLCTCLLTCLLPSSWSQHRLRPLPRRQRRPRHYQRPRRHPRRLLRYQSQPTNKKWTKPPKRFSSPLSPTPQPMNSSPTSRTTTPTPSSSSMRPPHAPTRAPPASSASTPSALTLTW